GHAQDYVEAMWLMLQQDDPGDYVVATGESRSVKEFVEAVFGRLDLDWQQFVELDPRYLRPSEVDSLLGGPSKSERVLGWQAKVTFEELVDRMVANDMELARQEKTLRDAGHLVAARGAAQG